MRPAGPHTPPASRVPPGDTGDREGGPGSCSAPRTLSPVQSGLRWSPVGVRGWGHLTQWYLGGSSLLVVMKVTTARTKPTSVTSPQTGKMPWIWYSPSARGIEREHQSSPARHRVGWGRIRPGLSPKATSTLSPHGPAPLRASVSPDRRGLLHFSPRTWVLGQGGPHPQGRMETSSCKPAPPAWLFAGPSSPPQMGCQLRRASTVPRALVAISVPSPLGVQSSQGSYRRLTSG